jgi:tungstate transport system substrate-binding protein
MIHARLNLSKEKWCTEVLRILTVYAVCLAWLVGCSSEPQAGGPVQPSQSPQAITLATTTSTQDSGLLDEILPWFKRESGMEVKVVAVGSGQAMELGRRGDADVLLVHSPAAEQKFMDDGFGAKRLAVMHNDFVVLGPAEDSAKVKAARSAADAFKSIAGAKSRFVSRGDESGTHAKEREIWQAAGVQPAGEWYLSAGTGMAQAVRIANEKQAYILTDRATYLALKGELDLLVLAEGDERLLNRYSVITVNTARHPHIRARQADRFAEYLVSPKAQEAIGAFRVEQYGQPLFFPDAVR